MQCPREYPGKSRTVNQCGRSQQIIQQ